MNNSAVVKEDFKLENMRVLEFVNGEFVVIECSETKWKVCCNCILFDNCIFKERNRTGIIPNLKEDFQEFISKSLF